MDKFDFGPLPTIGMRFTPFLRAHKTSKKVVQMIAISFFDRIFIRLAGNEDSYKILDELAIEADRAITIRVTCPLVFRRHKIGKMLSGQ